MLFTAINSHTRLKKHISSINKNVIATDLNIEDREEILIQNIYKNKEKYHVATRKNKKIDFINYYKKLIKNDVGYKPTENIISTLETNQIELTDSNIETEYKLYENK